MSISTRKPNIKLLVSAEWFNLLIFALKQNIRTVNNETVKQEAAALVDKLLKYSRPYTDDDTQSEMVDMRFFPDEASDMIWQLIVTFGLFYKSADEDYYSQLKVNHIPNSPTRKEFNNG